MAFRALFAAAFLLFILNLEDAFGLESTNFITKSLLLVAGLTLILTRRPLVPIVLACALMTLVTFVSANFTRNPDFSWPLYLRSITQFIVPLLLVAAIPTREDRDFVLRFLSWAPIFCVALGAAYDVTGRGALFGMDASNGALRLRGSLIASFLAGLALSGTFAALQQALASRRYLALAVVNIIIILLTAARMPVALSLLISLAWLWLSFGGGFGIKVLISAGATIGLSFFLLFFGDALIARFSSQNMSGREIMWEYLLVLLADFYDFGVGYGHQQTMIPHEVLVIVNTHHAHNDYLRIAVEIGLWPAIVFFSLWLLAMLFLWFHPRSTRDPMLLVGTLAFAILAITDNAVSTSTHFPLLVIAAVSCMRPSETWSHRNSRNSANSKPPISRVLTPSPARSAVASRAKSVGLQRPRV